MRRKAATIVIVLAGLVLLWTAGRLFLRAVEPPEPATTAVFKPYTPGMTLREAFESLPALGGDTAALSLFDRNVAAWVARWRLLAETKHTLDISYFILKRDIFGASFLGHLLKKAREGVKIRIFLDAQGSQMSSSLRGNDYLDTLVNTKNVELRYHRPKINRYLEAFLALDPVRAVASEHDKIIVCDSYRSLIGGRNIAEEYFAHPDDLATAFQDADLLLEGKQVAGALTQAFESQYQGRDTKTIKPEAVDITSFEEELLAAQETMEAWLKNKPISAKTAELTKKRDLTWQEELNKLPRLRGASTRMTTPKFNGETRILDSHTRLEAKGDAIGEGIIRLVRSTRRHIVVQTPYLVLSEEAVAVMEDAGRRGVAITIVTNSPISSDNGLAQAFFLEQWPELLARVAHLRIFVGGDKHNIHSKTATFDDQVALVGTYNLDPLSMAINSEVVAVVWSADFAKQVAAKPRRMVTHGAPKLYEYRIQRDAKGEPKRDDKGKVMIAFGPNDHASPEAWKKTKVFWDVLKAADKIPGFSPIF